MAVGGGGEIHVSQTHLVEYRGLDSIFLLLESKIHNYWNLESTISVNEIRIVPIPLGVNYWDFKLRTMYYHSDDKALISYLDFGHL